MAKLCTEMSIQLLGGPIRFHPKNNHQKPNVCILANNCLQGAYAMCTARLLSIRNCNVYLYYYNATSSTDHHVSTEYNLFKLSDAKQVKSIERMLYGCNRVTWLFSIIFLLFERNRSDSNGSDHKRHRQYGAHVWRQLVLGSHQVPMQMQM